MSQSYINNGERGDTVRAKLNDRFQVLGQSSVAVSCGADTTEDALATVTIPAGAMGANGRLRITTVWTMTNSANNKTMRVRLGGIAGTIYMTSTQTAQATLRDQREISNRNAQNSQVGAMSGTSGGFGLSTSAVVTSAVDTTADTTVVVTGQKASAGEALTLESYMVELLYSA